MSVSLQDTRAGIYWKDAGVLQGIEARVGLGRLGTRAALRASAVVVFSPLAIVSGVWKKTQSMDNMAPPCLSTSHEGG